MSWCSENKTKKSKILEDLFLFLPFRLSVHDIHFAVHHMSLLIAYNAGFYDPAWLLQQQIIVRFSFFLRFFDGNG